MGIKPTQTNFKTFTFNGASSRTYGVYITGEGVFNAPERNVEMVDIPGRNGSYALDRGNFNNIEVTYPAGIFADTESDFAEAVSNLRNLLCSQNGYVRLEDDYNPNEYRLAIYKSGLEVSHDLLIAGEFNITFDCKPQRFLKSGETATSVTSGNTITNPTRFESHPQLQVKGYGDIDINGNAINVANVPLGTIQLRGAMSNSAKTDSGTYTQSGINMSQLNTGDDIIIDGKKIDVVYYYPKSTPPAGSSITSATITSTTNCSATCSYTETSATANVTLPQMVAQKGTSSTFTASCTLQFIRGGTTYTKTLSFTTVFGSGTNVSNQWSITSGVTQNEVNQYIPVIYGVSTKTATGNPLYIDLDIGEAWNEDGGEPVSLNNAVQLPAELPTLAPGNNTITYDNTFTSFKVVPRWWQV